MRLLGLAQGVAVAHRDGQRAVGDRGEQLTCAPGEFIGCAGVVSEIGSGQEHRPRCVKPLRVQWRDRAAGRAEQRDRAAYGKTGQAGLERRGAHAVVDGRDTIAVGQLADAGPELCGAPLVVAGIVEHLHRTGLPGQFGFVRGRYRRDHRGREAGCPLREDQADTAGPGMHQHGVALLHRIRRLDQVVRCHTLQQR